MIRIKNSAALLLIGLTVSGCATDFRGPKPNFASNKSLYSENQPVVHHTDYVFDVATNGAGVPGTELARLRDWFDSLNLRYGDRITIDDAADSSAVREDVARLTAHFGLLLGDGAPVTAGMVPAGSARVIVSRSTATVPTCPNWRQSKLQGEVISTAGNYGCSINSNLAAMIADPDDLVLGAEAPASIDPALADKAVKKYRTR